jgi:hypothetical protein
MTKLFMRAVGAALLAVCFVSPQRVGAVVVPSASGLQPAHGSPTTILNGSLAARVAGY